MFKLNGSVYTLRRYKEGWVIQRAQEKIHAGGKRQGETYISTTDSFHATFRQVAKYLLDRELLDFTEENVVEVKEVLGFLEKVTLQLEELLALEANKTKQEN